MGAGLALLSLFPNRALIELVGLGLIGVPAIAFIPLYFWKADRDPDFCRSESHVQKIIKYELEMFGSEERQVLGAS
jgi:hypothetical protein